jgi:LysM domain
MSVMSAAETGSSPDVPRRRLRVAAPAGQDDGGPAASPPGAAAESGPAAADHVRPRLGASELRATELRVREVRVVREASIRTLRAGASRSSAAQARAASQARTAQILAVTCDQAAAEARAAAGMPPAGSMPSGNSARLAASTRPAAAQTRVVTRSRVAAQVRATRTRTVSHRARRPGAVRLTRRGRLVVAGFATLVVIAAVTLLWMTVAGSAAASSRGGLAHGSPYQGMHQVMVRPGQTLWSIAVAAEPSANAWAVVQRITEVNALNGPEVHAGQLLWVPNG